jgi:hypothetical protein
METDERGVLNGGCTQAVSAFIQPFIRVIRGKVVAGPRIANHDPNHDPNH